MKYMTFYDTISLVFVLKGRELYETQKKNLKKRVDENSFRYSYCYFFSGWRGTLFLYVKAVS